MAYSLFSCFYLHVTGGGVDVYLVRTVAEDTGIALLRELEVGIEAAGGCVEIDGESGVIRNIECDIAGGSVH